MMYSHKYHYNKEGFVVSEDLIGPHWGYWGPNFPEGVRINPEGSWGHK